MPEFCTDSTHLVRPVIKQRCLCGEFTHAELMDRVHRQSLGRWQLNDDGSLTPCQ